MPLSLRRRLASYKVGKKIGQQKLQKYEKAGKALQNGMMITPWDS